MTDERIAELERIIKKQSIMLDHLSRVAGYQEGQTYTTYGIINRLREQGRALDTKLETVTRFEVIGEKGRIYSAGPMNVNGPVSVELHLQDDNRTLKAFIKKRQAT